MTVTALVKKGLPRSVKAPFNPRANEGKFSLGNISMDGWTALTDTATLGGGSLIVGAGQTYLVTTGSDGGRYIAPLNPSAPGVIDSSQWMNLPDTLAGEAHCQTASCTPPGDDFLFACVAMGASGNSLLCYISHDAKSGNIATRAKLDLGGVGAPQFIGSPGYSRGDAPWGNHTRWPTAYSADIGVATAGSQLWTISSRTGGRQAYDSAFGFGPMVAPATADTGWSVQKGVFGAPPSYPPASSEATCAATCAATTLLSGHYDEAVSLYQTQQTGNAFVDEFLHLEVAKLDGSSPASPKGPSGETTIIRTKAGRLIIVARGLDYQLYQIIYSPDSKTFVSGWKLEGGNVLAKTSPSCIALNEQPLCMIQGADGRLYAKKLVSAGAL
ncbi:hypothetical protein [Asticcacaulis benevestitus]|uniref:Uncharacterized protein n=1 Tax=Asticcacaulis benevestitus DSM 16100 = ATCC BAA-896 TaxID=1121022 RepID=V4PSY7_9CAUL|nr:hypothetical protein [Asticcacaulis benevestitus]ESQ90484.1 hypothetical protein ABENE_12235 [Asticcacaulis benevestitus DSM 16100 = ATCC BAA-896]